LAGASDARTQLKRDRVTPWTTFELSRLPGGERNEAVRRNGPALTDLLWSDLLPPPLPCLAKPGHEGAITLSEPATAPSARSFPSFLGAPSGMRLIRRQPDAEFHVAWE